MSPLERRYRRLLRAYPAAYRAERGDEIVGTYLDLAAPDRRWPGPADVADLARGGARQHLRAAGAGNLAPALPVAATVALAFNTVLAVWWFVTVESGPVHGFGMFASTGVVVWAGWGLAGLAALFGRARLLVGPALAVTVLDGPVSAVLGLPRPPLLILVPMSALGLVASALPRRRRLGPVAAGAVIAAYAWPLLLRPLYENPVDYYWLVGIQLVVAEALLFVVLAVGLVLTARRDRRAWWPALILLGPGLLLVVNQLALAATGNASAGRAPMPALVATTAAVLGVSVLAFAVTLGVHRRRWSPAAPER